MSNNKLYAGGLPYEVDDGRLRELFSPHGTVDSAKVIMDRSTGRSKGFGFVEMSSETEAQAAISSLNGANVDGRSLTVNVAKPREPRGNSGAHGFGSGDRW